MVIYVKTPLRYFSEISIAFLVFSHCCYAKNFVERIPQNGENLAASNDTFSNPRSGYDSFCKDLKATCGSETTKQCDVCICKERDIWVSYKKGCRSSKFLEQMVNGYDDSNRFKHGDDTLWIPTVRQNTSENRTFKLSSRHSTTLPSNINTANYQCISKRLFNIYNESKLLSSEFSDNIVINNTAGQKSLQFTDSMRLTNLSGMLLLLEIECSNGSQITAFFLFKVEGRQYLPDIPMYPTHAPTTKEKNGNEDDNNVMDVVKPVVIVGCIVLVFVCVIVYCLCKRRQFIAEQKKARMEDASRGDRRSVVSMSVNNGVRNAVKMSTVTVISDEGIFDQRYGRDSAFEKPNGFDNNGFLEETELETSEANQTANTSTPKEEKKLPPVTFSLNNNNNNNSPAKENKEYSEINLEQSDLPADEELELRNINKPTNFEGDNNTPINYDGDNNEPINYDGDNNEPINFGGDSNKSMNNEGDNHTSVELTNEPNHSIEADTNESDIVDYGPENTSTDSSIDNPTHIFKPKSHSFYNEIMKECDRIRSLPRN